MADIERYILEHFKYHSDGSVTRNDRKNSNGSFDKDGYLILKIKGKKYRASRVVWLLNYGHFPEKEIDHINRDRTDNRIENLRDVARITNILNRTINPNKKTGYPGIYIDETTNGLIAKYTFRLNGKTYRFRTLEEAVSKKEDMKGDLYGRLSEIG